MQPKTSCIKPPKISTIAIAFSIYSISASFSLAQAQEAEQWENWSLQAAERALEDARYNISVIEWDIGENLPCNDPRLWEWCTDIDRKLEYAFDQIHNVWTGHVDFNRECRHSSITRAWWLAGDINQLSRWLQHRYYDAGLSDMEFTILQYMDLPLCSQPTPDLPPPDPLTPVQDPSLVASHPCADYQNGGEPNFVWNWYSFGGAGGFNGEVAQFICYNNTPGYIQWSDTNFESYLCDENWQNCRRDGYFNATVTEVSHTYYNDGSVAYFYEKEDGSTGWGRRALNSGS